MKFFLFFLEILLGLTFFLSGLVKLIDPIGFSYKLEEYFSESVLGIPTLEKYSLIISVLFCFYETLLGFLLLIRVSRKIILFQLLALSIFFSFLTFYSAYFDKVKSCGCFGDAISLTPWESFIKDIILVCIIILLLFKSKVIYKLAFSFRCKLILLPIALYIFSWIPYRGINGLPLVDFTPYAKGKSIIRQMASAKELGLKPPKYEVFYFLINKNSKEKKTVSSAHYIQQGLWKDTNWELQQDKTIVKLIEKGYEPPIKNFKIEREYQDITKDILNKDLVLLVINKYPDRIKGKPFLKLINWLEEANFFQIPTLLLSTSFESYHHEIKDLRNAFVDPPLLKTMIRSDPGFLILKKGKVVGKWHWKDKIPNLEYYKN